MYGEKGSDDVPVVLVSSLVHVFHQLQDCTQHPEYTDCQPL